MKLLLDQGLPRTAAEVLRKSGIDTAHTAECGLSTASDHEILEAARAAERVVVTLDSDFHTILALEGRRGPSVIRLRWEGLRGSEVADLLQQVIRLCRSELAAGAVVSVRPDGLRVRGLPVLRQPLD